MKNKITEFIESVECGRIFNELYGNDITGHMVQKKRYTQLVDEYLHLFGKLDYSLFSAPGRIEIIGNHTDHNAGKVIAAAVNLDALAAAAGTGDNRITIHSRYTGSTFAIDLNDTDIHEGEDSSQALARGIAAGFRERGYAIGGFNALIDSMIMPGSGISSSAAYEMLICTILNYFYNNGSLDPIALAKTSQFAENNYMKKPSGLMDQTACAAGGIMMIDFYDMNNPVLEKISCNLSDDVSIIIVNTGGSHENLTPQYASITGEMKAVADFFGKQYLREISRIDILENFDTLRQKAGDRAVLRAFHFLDENRRVDELAAALKENDLPAVYRLINESGNSSLKYLQNCHAPSSPKMGISIGLYLTEQFIAISGGACRVHGGGFAGTILVFLPGNYVKKYILMIEKIFGNDSAKILNVRQNGSMMVF